MVPLTEGQKAREVMPMLLVMLALRRRLRHEVVVLQSGIGNQSAPGESHHVVSARHHGASRRHHAGLHLIVDLRHLAGAFLRANAAAEAIVRAHVVHTEELPTEIGVVIDTVVLHGPPDVSAVEAIVSAGAVTEAAETEDFGKIAGAWSHGAEGEESTPWSHHLAAVTAAKMAAVAVVELEVGVDGEAAAAMLEMTFGMTAAPAEQGVTNETM